ncbi:MAG: MoxR family ATPase [Nitrososphaerota archaeon]
MTEFNQLAQEIYPLCKFLFKDNGPSGSSSVEDLVKEIELVDPDKWEIKGKDVKHAFKRYIKEVNPAGYDAVEKKFGRTFYKTLDLIPPFGVLFVASGAVSHEEFIKTVLDAPGDAQIIPNFIPEEKFVQTLWDMYRHWKKFMEVGVSISTDGVSVPKLPSLTPEKKTTLDHLLTTFEAPKWTEIESFIKEAGKVQSALARDLEIVKQKAATEVAEARKSVKEMSEAVSRLSKELAAKPFEDAKVVGDGTIPNGKIVMKSVGEIFPELKKLKMDIPVWEWDGIHPDVPAIDPHYIFREDLLVKTLYAVLTNQRMYLQGHTGAGKTTLVEQVAAHLNWPFTRINFDSEITRMDLIGRDTLQDGKSVVVDGMLPRAMSGPYICVFDELDFCRPDVSYVMQAALEGNGLNITEDGGRIVTPHPYFRMFGTGNTVGQGDEHGMYQGARPQSLAFLDRFTIWAKVDYLSEEDREALLKRHFPALSDEEAKVITKYSTEHLDAFEKAKVLQPISPRGMLAIARAVIFFNSIYPMDKKNLHRALTQTIVDRATEADGAVLKGLVDRVAKG